MRAPPEPFGWLAGWLAETPANKPSCEEMFQSTDDKLHWDTSCEFGEREFAHKRHEKRE